MRKFINLSYTLSKDTPVYPGDMPVSILPVRQIKKGDTCNTSSVSLSSHAGTHMDVPYHFFENGRRLDDYGREDFIFEKPYILDCPKKSAEAIIPEDIRIEGKGKKADMIILKTGFGRYRSRNKQVYCHQNPYLSPEAAEYIVRNFPGVRAVGVDTISISSKINRNAGREVHRILLGKGIVIIEDMCLSGGLKKIVKVAVFPLFTSSLDGSPCVVVGLEND